MMTHKDGAKILSLQGRTLGPKWDCTKTQITNTHTCTCVLIYVCVCYLLENVSKISYFVRDN